MLQMLFQRFFLGAWLHSISTAEDKYYIMITVKEQ